MLDPAHPQASLDEAVGVAADLAGDTPLEQVRLGALGPFSPPPGGQINYGYSPTAYWARVVLAPKTDGKWFLEVDDPTVDRFEVVLWGPSGKMTEWLGGDRRPFGVRPLSSRTFVFPLPLKGGESYTVYFHFHPDLINAPLRVYTFDGLRHKELVETLILGLYFGALVVMFFYNLFLFTSTGDRNYLYYISFLGVFGAILFVLSGVGFQYLWPDAPWVQFEGILVLSLVVILPAAVYSRNFLDTRNHQIWVDRLFLILMAAALVLLPFSFIHPPQWLFILSNGLSLVITLVCLTAGTVALIRWQRSARFYVMAWTSLMAGVVILLFNVLGILPTNVFTQYAIYLGSAMEFTLFSLALADRYKLILQEKSQAQAELVESLQRESEIRIQYSHNLEEQVINRTGELLQALDEVTQLNATKDRLFTLLAHDLKNPFQSLLPFSESLAKESQTLTREEIGEFSSRIHATLERVYGFLVNLLQWGRLQMQQQAVTKKPVALLEKTTAVEHLFGHSLHGKNLKFSVEMDPGLRVMTDPDMLAIILTNLIGNAIKFTPPGGSITVRAAPLPPQSQVEGGREVSPCMARIQVEDTGIGITPEDQERIFKLDELFSTPGTQNERGSGFGLILVKESVESNGGNLTISSTPGQGTTFTFTLAMA
ncbi:MAG: sensor histidine kinase [Deltaproteobacteria bacterium]|nr:sensor histidine kinase [Deltaproteobacteria bacterium]